ncbi:hypothetical protein [Paenirhodobacter sp.]|uniref:hypothetical protein n=1 Tax=Paenirhodobacter sp. TaxID=1965326 RepID=UPI003B3D081F
MDFLGWLNEFRQMVLGWPIEVWVPIIISLVAALAAVIAAGAAIISAVAAVDSARSSRQLAALTKKGMQRKPPSFELTTYDKGRRPEGWDCLGIKISNLETVSVDVTSIRTKRKDHYIIEQNEAYDGSEPSHPFPTFKDPIPQDNVVELGTFRVEPAGKTSGQEYSGVEDVCLFSQGVSDVNDLEFQWKWADGRS